MKKDYNTKTQSGIKEFIKNCSDKGFCASQVKEYLNSLGMEPNPTTVYRNLDAMVAKEELVKYKAPNSESYMYRVVNHKDCHTHLHLQCSVCGKVIHTDHDFTDKLVKQIEDGYGFKLDMCDASFAGVCDSCANK
ncbi:MAG: transcriptional repressor [Lachnospiraceae bacterium]|nr:transcriptional repressor [Lachnospiraceae bacterium]